jgi:hypothetical protein
MNTKLFTPINMFLRIVTLWALLAASLYSATPLCDIVESWTRLNERLHQEGLTLGQNLKNKLDGDPTISARPRFQNHPGGLTPKMAAQQVIDEGLGRVEQISPLRIGDKGAAAWVDTVTSERVLSADTIPIETMAEGYGHLVDRIPNRFSSDYDTKTEDLLRKNTEVFNTGGGIYSAANYGEAHMLRDAKIVFENNANLVTNDFAVSLASGTRGIPFELHVAAKKRAGGESLLEMDSHNTYPGSDLVTNQAVYNHKISTDGITTSIVDSGTGQLTDYGLEVVEGVKKATLASKPYIFTSATGSTTQVSTAFNLINAELPPANHLSLANNFQLIPLD